MMGKSSKAALEADQRIADAVKRSTHFTRRCREQFYRECAELAARCGTGEQASALILSELERAHSGVEKVE